MADLDYTSIVDQYYNALYRFAFSLARNEANASDLTQQAFYILASKGHQLRDHSKVKSWLFTTLHREFLAQRRREAKHPHYEVGMVESELPNITPNLINQLDIETVMIALDQIDEMFRVPLVLFHIEDNSYREIAEILDIPIGTVMSRIARGREQLYRLLADRFSERSRKIIRIPVNEIERKEKRGI